MYMGLLTKLLWISILYEIGRVIQNIIYFHIEKIILQMLHEKTKPKEIWVRGVRVIDSMFIGMLYTWVDGKTHIQIMFLLLT